MERISVALDSRTLQDVPPGGIGRVLAHVVGPLSEEFDLTLLTDARRPRPSAVGSARVVDLRSPAPTQTGWLQLAAPRWLRNFDGVFHCPFYGLPALGRVPMVVSFWDLTFEFRPEWFSTARRVAFRAQARYAARVARRVLVAADVTACDVVERYGVAPERILVAPHGVDAVFHPRADDDVSPVLQRLNISSPYALAFSGAPRRRLDLAIAGWRKAGGADLCSLVVAGPAEAVPPDRGIVALGRVDDATLAVVLAGAVALVYPTEYEGFGLPALEAQASGVPVVCARVGALPDTLSGVAAWVDELTPTAIAAALAPVATNPTLRASLRDEGVKAAAARPGWDACVDAFTRAYRESVD